MQIEVSEFGKMSQSGSSLLKLIQNNDMPILDLLVREAVQNSLDAGINACDSDSVYVDIGIKFINVSGFSKHLSGITDYLNTTYGSMPQKAIYIEDANTTGLTGSLDFNNDPNSNIYKLVYGISMAQDKQGAGGSWGLGKTVYFRAGIGLVVYYSKIINEEGKSEHRLAVTLVENEKSPNTIIPKSEGKIPSGIAWWGQQVESNNQGTVPITDEKEIFGILDSLSIKPFEEGKVGTKIIIPFINEQQLLIKHDINISEKKAWETNVSDYISVAMQRWYAPRLDNKKYKYGKYLEGHVNGEKLEREDFLTTFLEMQMMYNAATHVKESNRFIVSDIKIFYYFEHNRANNAGKVAYKKFTKKELDMLAPINGVSPFTSANVKNTSIEGNAPLLAYARKPGMIVNYETDGEWCKGIGATEENEYIMGIFVPNSETKLSEPDNDIVDLEGYLRKSEMADHTSWSDIIVNNKPFDIVDKIRQQVRRKIKLSFEVKEQIKNKQGKNTLARNVGKMLLPPTGFGRRAASRNKGGEGEGYERNNGGTGNSFKILSQNYLSNGAIEVHFRIKLEKKVSAFTTELFIASEGGKISAPDWEEIDNIGTPFPASITQISFSETTGLVEQSTVKTANNKVEFGVYIKKQNIPINCVGSLVVECIDPHIQIEIAMKPEGSGSNA